MTAYVISDVVGRDPELVDRYRELAQESISRHGGWYLTNVGAQIDHVEGDWTPRNIVIVGFPSMARARAWYRSPEYAPALEIRRDALDRDVVFVAGADERWRRGNRCPLGPGRHHVTTTRRESTSTEIVGSRGGSKWRIGSFVRWPERSSFSR